MKTRTILMLCLACSIFGLLGCNKSEPAEAPTATTKAPPSATGAKNGAQMSGAPAPEVNSNYNGGVGTKAK